VILQILEQFGPDLEQLAGLTEPLQRSTAAKQSDGLARHPSCPLGSATRLAHPQRHSPPS